MVASRQAVRSGSLNAVTQAEKFAVTDVFLIASFVLFAIGAFCLRFPVLRFLTRYEITARNYKGRTIPTAAGIYLWLSFNIFIVFLSLFHPIQFALQIGVWLVFSSSMTIVFFVGWLDDTIGENDVKGMSGHVRFFRETKTMTTGLLKAVTVVIVSFWSVIYVHVHVHEEQFVWLAVQWFLIVLLTNSLNLMDLRPGRALKSSLLLITVLLFCAHDSQYISFLFPLIIGILALLPEDLKAKAMIGDAGANLIGYAIGFCYAISAPYWLLTLVLSLAIALHITAERTSISLLIARNRLLNWLDEVGRSKT